MDTYISKGFPDIFDEHFTEMRVMYVCYIYHYYCQDKTVAKIQASGYLAVRFFCFTNSERWSEKLTVI